MLQARQSLASNNEFTEAFQAIVSVLYSLHHLRGVAIAYSYRLRECTCDSPLMSNCPDTCDSLHVT